LIEKHKKSNVIFLSGDVHYSQGYLSVCKGRIGYKIPEYTSSGLSHTIGTWVPLLKHLAQIITDPIYSDEKPIVDFNYGEITVNKTHAHIEIKTTGGDSFWPTTFDLSKDLQFKK
jgi:phosphodiesterase/alkaline phosphatase D-like protein